MVEHPANIEYSKKVMEHFQNPRNVGEIPDADGIGKAGNPVCITPETLILVNPGVKEIRYIKKTDQVLGCDGKYHRVTKTHSRLYKGKIYEIIINNLGRAFLTPEHHVLAIKPPKYNKFKLYQKSRPDWYCAEELSKGDLVLYPLPKEVVKITEIGFDIDKPKWDFKSKALPERLKLDNNFCRLVGYYLAEGYVRTDKCKGTIGFVFNSKEKAYIKDVLDLMRNIFNLETAGPIESHRGTSIDIPFYSARLARFFERYFGKGAENKQLPFWMMQLPLEKQRSLLCSLWRGDGYLDLKRQRAKYVTISPKLAYQLRMLLLRQKIISNFSEGKPYGIHKKSYLIYIQDDNSLKKIIKIMGLEKKIKPKSLNTHKSWLDENFYYTTIRDIKPIGYDGMVYNLEVEEAHSFASNALALHNCGDVLNLYIKVKDGIITDAKFKTWGCGAAIATSSILTELVKGRTVDEALKISNKAVAEALDGLPPIKMHCSVLAEEGLKAAIEDYLKKKKT